MQSFMGRLFGRFTRQNNLTWELSDDRRLVKTEIERDLYAQGSCKWVFRGFYANGPNAGDPCVAKFFKAVSGTSFEEQLQNEFRVINMAQRIVQAWNSFQGPLARVAVSTPVVMSEDTADGAVCLVEPLLRLYRKHNDNGGWVDLSEDLWNQNMQALSHFSFHCTNGKVILCDVQGGLYNNGYVLTDPAILSTTTGKYGSTDLGREGIIKFFENHQCNPFYCKSHWITPETLQYDDGSGKGDPRWRQPAPARESRPKDNPRWKQAAPDMEVRSKKDPRWKRPSK
ncbi:hypothetical protein PG989_014218 [Apiospora arundinis]